MAVEAVKDPQALAAELLPLVEARLVQSELTIVDIQASARMEVYIHLQCVFDTQILDDTPLDFIPVPDCEGVIFGKAASIAALAAVGQQAISYGSENEGELFVNLVVIPGDGSTSEKSKSPMRGHTDAASFPPRGHVDTGRPSIAPSPDFVCLVGLRNPENVPTTVMPLSTILKRLSTQHVDELKIPQFDIQAQETFVRGTKRTLGESHIAQDVALLYDIDDQIGVRFSHKRVSTDESDAAEEALTAFKAACPECGEDVIIRPGDLFLVSNRFALHGRAEVGDDVGGKTRWLLRTYGLINGGAHKDQFRNGSRFMLFP